DPDIGRYLTPDPVKLAGGLNQYRYVPNPTGWVDPLGLTSNCPPPNKPGCSVPGDVSGTKVNEGEPLPPTIFLGVDPKSLKRTHAISGKGSTKRVEKLGQDMRKAGYDNEFPIDVAEHNGNLYILDGHHRAAAARQTSTDVTITLVTNIKEHKGILNSIEEVLESAANVGHDRLEHHRRR
ncbi:RHS repeat-associated core domain-containing protein, partial [Pseudomonas sp. V88_4]